MAIVRSTRAKGFGSVAFFKEQIMRFLAMLMPVLTSFAGKILAALGITAITYVGFDVLVKKFKSLIVSHVGAMATEWLGLFNLVGGGEVLNIIFAAMAFSVSFQALSKLGTSLGAKK